MIKLKIANVEIEFERQEEIKPCGCRFIRQEVEPIEPNVREFKEVEWLCSEHSWDTKK